VVHMGGSGLPMRDSDAVCGGCGARGTVGNAARTGQDAQVLEVHRFCVKCWPEWQARLQARWKEEDRLATDAWFRERGPEPPSRGMAFEAVTWHSTLELVKMLMRATRHQTPPSESDLRRLAAAIASQAADLEGEMPFEVE